MKKIVSAVLSVSMLFAMAACSKAPTGEYSYTIYEGTDHEMSLSMDINVDDYISEENGAEYFNLVQVAYDLGWLGMNRFTAEDDSDGISYKCPFFTFRNGDMLTKLSIEGFPPDDSLWLLNIGWMTEDGSSSYWNDWGRNYSHKGLQVFFPVRDEASDYRLSGYEKNVSYDEIVLISYVLWAQTVEPGINCLVAVAGVRSSYCTDRETVLEYNMA